MSYQLVPQFKGEDLNLCLSPKPRVGAVKAKFQFRSLGPARPRGHSATMKAFDNIPLKKKGGGMLSKPCVPFTLEAPPWPHLTEYGAMKSTGASTFLRHWGAPQLSGLPLAHTRSHSRRDFVLQAPPRGGGCLSQTESPAKPEVDHVKYWLGGDRN